MYIKRQGLRYGKDYSIGTNEEDLTLYLHRGVSIDVLDLTVAEAQQLIRDLQQAVGEHIKPEPVVYKEGDKVRVLSNDTRMHKDDGSPYTYTYYDKVPAVGRVTHVYGEGETYEVEVGTLNQTVYPDQIELVK